MTPQTSKGINALVWQEDDLFVAEGVELDIASQGRTETEALINLQEAVDLYLSDEPPHKRQITPRHRLKLHQLSTCKYA